MNKLILIALGSLLGCAALAGEFAPAYFWIWNDRLEPVKLTAQLDDMRARPVKRRWANITLPDFVP